MLSVPVLPVTRPELSSFTLTGGAAGQLSSVLQEQSCRVWFNEGLFVQCQGNSDLRADLGPRI